MSWSEAQAAWLRGVVPRRRGDNGSVTNGIGGGSTICAIRRNGCAKLSAGGRDVALVEVRDLLGEECLLQKPQRKLDIQPRKSNWNRRGSEAGGNGHAAA